MKSKPNYNNSLTKAYKIIESCKTPEQLKIASNYCKLLINKFFDFDSIFCEVGVAKELALDFKRVIDKKKELLTK